MILHIILPIIFLVVCFTALFLSFTYVEFQQRIKVVTYESGVTKCFPQYKKGWRWHCYYHDKCKIVPVSFLDTINGTGLEICQAFVRRKHSEYLDRKVKKVQYTYYC